MSANSFEEDPEQVTLPEDDPGEGRQVQPSMEDDPVGEPQQVGGEQDPGGVDTQLSPNRD